MAITPKLKSLFTFVLIISFGVTSVSAQTDTDQHDVTIDVNVINRVDVKSDITIVVDKLNENLVDATVKTTDLDVSTNSGADKRIDAEVSGAISDEVTLEVSLVGVDGVNTGYFSLSSDNQKTLAEGFSNIKQTGELKYRAAVTPAFDPSSNEVVTVEYTLLNQ